MRQRKFVRSLTDEEREKLLNKLSDREHLYPSIYRKVMAILLSDQGKTVKEIAEELGVTEQAVIYIIRNFEKEGIDAFLNKRGGRKEKFTDEHKEIIVRLVQQFKPVEFGLKEKFWTYDAISKVMKRVYNVKISHNTIRKILLDKDIDLKQMRYKTEEKTPKSIMSIIKKGKSEEK